MSTRRLLCAGFTLTGLIAGCKSNNPPPSARATPVAVSSGVLDSHQAPGLPHASPAVEQGSAPIDPHAAPDVVASATRQYAQALEKALARRSSSGQHVSPSPVAAGPNMDNSGAARGAISAAGTGARAVADAPMSVPNDHGASLHLASPGTGGASSQPAGANTDVPANASANPTHVGGDPAGQLASASQSPSSDLSNVGVSTNPPGGSANVPEVTQTPGRGDAVFNKDTPALNTPLILGQPRPLPATDDLARKFQQQARDFPHDVAAQLDWQLLEFLQGQSVPDLKSLSALQNEDREMLCALLDGLSNFRTGLRADNNMLLSRKIRPLLELDDRLRTQAELAIPTLALCTEVKGFGTYTPIEPARFVAGASHRVIVYCEVDNFASQLDPQKRWETRLSQEVVLYTEQGGLEVWRDKAAGKPIVDYSRKRRRDFFIVKMIRLPVNLTIGRYLLKVSVNDLQASRVAENTVPVQIVAQ